MDVVETRKLSFPTVKLILTVNLMKFTDPAETHSGEYLRGIFQVRITEVGRPTLRGGVGGQYLLVGCSQTEQKGKGSGVQASMAFDS